MQSVCYCTISFPPPLRTERDASNWSSEKLKTLFLAIRVENAEGTCEVTEVSKLDGEASINNRKGKLIFFYEWNVKLAWKGELQFYFYARRRMLLILDIITKSGSL